MAKKRLAVITTHPIQYNAPWFRLLASTPGIDLKVFYTWSQSASGKKFDVEFGREIQWDIPLLDGYSYVFVDNIAADPGSHHFKGIITPSLNKMVREWNPDAILVIGWSFHSHLSCIRHFHGRIPILFRGDSTLLDERVGIKQVLRRLFLRWVYRHIDFALYAGKHNKDYFRMHGMREDQLVFTPHAIDNNRFADNSEGFYKKAAGWRRELGYKEDDIIILFAGKLEPQKDLGVLLKLAKQIKDERVKFLLVGNGALESQIKQEGAALPNVKFMDFQNQSIMPIVYRLGHIFILPSVSETWGLALNEAMACGLPVIASNKVGGAVDLIKPEENGFIFQSGDVDSLYNQLVNYIDIEKLRGMGERSAEIIREWSFDHIVTSITETLFKEQSIYAH